MSGKTGESSTRRWNQLVYRKWDLKMVRTQWCGNWGILEHLYGWMPVGVRGSVWKRHPGETRLEPSGQKGEMEETQTRAGGKPASCAITASDPPRTKTYLVYSLVFFMVPFHTVKALLQVQIYVTDKQTKCTDLGFRIYDDSSTSPASPAQNAPLSSPSALPGPLVYFYLGWNVLQNAIAQD